MQLHVTSSNFFSRIVQSEALVYNSYIYFQNSWPLYGNYSTLDSQTNTVISHVVTYRVKMASKTVTRSNCKLGLLHKLLRKNLPGISRRNIIACRADNEGLRERQINNTSFSLSIETTKH